MEQGPTAALAAASIDWRHTHLLNPNPNPSPSQWSDDITGHGTHVAGIIGAPQNGKGVVGAIPEGADIYYVRVFNNSGDVNQGQGYVYGSSLILAYTQVRFSTWNLDAC